MKLLVYIALVLGPLMVAASVDAVPDPPAVNPHSEDLKVSGLRQVPNTADDQWSQHDSVAFFAYPTFRRADFAGMRRTPRSGDADALGRSAGDPSPPAFF